jgi:hypothetical protein
MTSAKNKPRKSTVAARSATARAATGKPPRLTKWDRQWATLIAMHVRNNLEDIHADYGPLSERPEVLLSDEQMRLINPIVRNAVADMLHALANINDEQQAANLIAFCSSMIPDYWEPADLTEGYRSGWDADRVEQARRVGGAMDAMGAAGWQRREDTEREAAISSLVELAGQFREDYPDASGELLKKLALALHGTGRDR